MPPPRRTCSPAQATHIFDGLEAWPSHLMYVAGGRLQVFKPAEEVPELAQGGLLRLVEGWLREEQRARVEQRAAQQQQGGGSDGDYDSQIHLATWNNGWAEGRLTSSLKLSSNAVVRM